MYSWCTVGGGVGAAPSNLGFPKAQLFNPN